MKSIIYKYKYVILGFGIFFIGVFIGIYTLNVPDKELAFPQPVNFDPALVDDSMLFVKKYHKIAPFKLVNQNGDSITQNDYSDKIYVADFFFTTCPSICPIMTGNMKLLQEEFKNDPEIVLLSHSVTPVRDSVPVLKEYAIKKGVDDSKWNLVTGDKKQIYDLARKSYLAVKDAPYGGQYDMIHTENFLLVDKEGRLRGRSYDGTKTEEIEALIEDIYTLKKSYN